METEGIGEGINYIIGGVFLLTGITFLVSAWMTEKKGLKIRRIISGIILIVLFIFILLH